MNGTDPILAVDGVTVTYGGRRRTAKADRAVDDVTLTIAPGETLGLVGESGCGKSSLARTIVRLQRPAAGTIAFDGADITSATRSNLRRLRRGMALVFQDPSTSFNPRRRIRHSLVDAIRATHGRVDDGADDQIRDVLGMVGLHLVVLERYPHQLSGGQLQRVSIARALLCDPKLIVLDEPVSSLDVSVQAQIIEILTDIRDKSATALLFIAHDLAVVRQVCERVLIMYLGRIVEEGPTDEVFGSPRHPYTRALLDAVPVPDPAVRHERRARPLRLEITDSQPSDVGCRFVPRCWRATDVCRHQDPPLDRTGTRSVACHHPVVDEHVDEPVLHER